jgi:hypothetical protein
VESGAKRREPRCGVVSYRLHMLRVLLLNSAARSFTLRSPSAASSCRSIGGLSTISFNRGASSTLAIVSRFGNVPVCQTYTPRTRPAFCFSTAPAIPRGKMAVVHPHGMLHYFLLVCLSCLISLAKHLLATSASLSSLRFPSGRKLKAATLSHASSSSRTSIR